MVVEAGSPGIQKQIVKPDSLKGMEARYEQTLQELANVIKVPSVHTVASFTVCVCVCAELTVWVNPPLVQSVTQCSNEWVCFYVSRSHCAPTCQLIPVLVFFFLHPAYQENLSYNKATFTWQLWWIKVSNWNSASRFPRQDEKAKAEQRWCSCLSRHLSHMRITLYFYQLYLELLMLFNKA